MSLKLIIICILIIQLTQQGDFFFCYHFFHFNIFLNMISNLAQSASVWVNNGKDIHKFALCISKNTIEHCRSLFIRHQNQPVDASSSNNNKNKRSFLEHALINRFHRS
jgi:hypothetical protein